MKIKVSNLGFLKKANLVLAPLTILAGNNNTGKTYLSYLIFILMKSLRNIEISHKDLNAKKQLVITKKFLNKKIVENVEKTCKNLGYFFAAPSHLFSKVECILEIETEDIFRFLQEQSNKGKIETSFVDTREKIIVLTDVQREKIIWTLSVNEKNAKELSILTDKIARSTLYGMILQRFFARWINPVAITSERTGISLFYKELDSTRSAILDLLVEKDLPLDKYQLWTQLDKAVSKYALPIKENINTTRQESGNRSYSFLWQHKEKHQTLFQLWDSLVCGHFDNQGGNIKFLQNSDNIEIPLHLASSCSKSLLLLEIYLKYEAQQGDFLLIDEPELNLHPQAQRTMARLLAQLVQKGIKVLITTHSEIIIRELNNLMMLCVIKNKNIKFKKQSCLDYFDDEGIEQQDILGYVTTTQQFLVQAPKNEYGLNMSSFEDFIDNTNNISTEIIELIEEV